MSALLLLSMLLFSASNLPAQNTDIPVTPADNPEIVLAQPHSALLDPSSFDTMQIEANPDRNHVCFKIRAFIFETNDDRIPRFVRETTCPPSKARINEVNETGNPALRPAAGDK